MNLKILHKKEIPVAFGSINDVSPRNTMYCSLSIRDAKMPRGLKRSEYTEYKLIRIGIGYDLNGGYAIEKTFPIKDVENEIAFFTNLYNSIPNPATVEWLESKGFIQD